jgi:hypothetical protein
MRRRDFISRPRWHGGQKGPLVRWRIRSSGKIGESAGKIGGGRQKNAVASAKSIRDFKN